MAATYLRSLPYERFLDTRYWYAVRRQAMSRSGGRCEPCGRKSEEVHHRTYRNHGVEHLHLDDLVVLCSSCHQLIHEAAAFAKGGQ